jgi:hypothetical protein
MRPAYTLVLALVLAAPGCGVRDSTPAVAAASPAGWSEPVEVAPGGAPALRGHRIADLRAGPGGSLHALFLTDADGDGTATRLLYAAFDGARWSAPVPLAEAGSIGAAQLAVDADGRAHAAWTAGPAPADPRAPPAFTELLRRARTEGGWSPAERLYGAPAGSSVPVSGIAAAEAGGAVHLVYPVAPGGFADRVSTAAARAPLPAGPEGGEPRLAAGPGGALALADLRSSLPPPGSGGVVFRTDPWVRVFRDGGWGEPVRVHAAPATDSHKPQVAWDGRGVLHAVWLEADPGDILPVHLLHASSEDGVAWSAPVELAAGVPGRVLYSPRLALDGGGTLHLTFARFRDGLTDPRHFHLALSGGRGSAPEEILPREGPRGSELETAVDSRGRLHALWSGRGGAVLHAVLRPAAPDPEAGRGRSVPLVPR